MQSLSNPVQEGLSLANPDNAKPVKPCPRRTKFGKPSFWCQSFTSGAGVMHCTFLAFGAKSVWSGHSQYQKVPFAHTKVENASSRRQPWPFNIKRFLFHINNAENKPFNKTLNIKASFGLSNYQIELVQPPATFRVCPRVDWTWTRESRAGTGPAYRRWRKIQNFIQTSANQHDNISRRQVLRFLVLFDSIRLFFNTEISMALQSVYNPQFPEIFKFCDTSSYHSIIFKQVRSRHFASVCFQNFVFHGHC